MGMLQGNNFLYPSQLIVSDRQEWITTILGSCVSVCLYDNIRKTGGMNHYMLPHWNKNEPASPKYGNTAIKGLIEKLLQAGSKIENLSAKVFGGSNINQQAGNSFNIHNQNISVAKKILEEYKIPIISINVGGNLGRKIHFNPHTGEVLHKYINNTKSIQSFIK